MTQKIIFGFGSLISTVSLCATAPDATNIRPAYIKCFVREFSVWDPIGYTETNLDLSGIPFCALDVKKVSDPAARVNGVVFTVSGQSFERLLIREQGYDLLETIAYDYETNQAIGICEVFSANKNNATFDFNSAPQMRYLQNCLQSAKQYGEQFYKEFLSTTLINERPLCEITELIS